MKQFTWCESGQVKSDWPTRPLRRCMSSFLILSWGVDVPDDLFFGFKAVEGAWVDATANLSSRWKSVRARLAQCSQEVNSSWYRARVIELFGFHEDTSRWKWKLNLLWMRRSYPECISCDFGQWPEIINDAYLLNNLVNLFNSNFFQEMSLAAMSA